MRQRQAGSDVTITKSLPYGSGFAGTSVGSASHATYPVLVEAEGFIHGLASRTRIGIARKLLF